MSCQRNSMNANMNMSGTERPSAIAPHRPATEVGVVVIGRNEGDRLRRCLESVVGKEIIVFYVDSGSTDGSIELARRYEAEVVALDTSVPFCAARARNVGFQSLLESHPQLKYVQFIDGDCEIIGDWLSHAVKSLQERPDHAIVTGWLREKFPDASIYNSLGELEWNFSSAGEVEAVGGIFMIRSEAFDSVGGFDATIAAGEEPELCQRLIREGWRLIKLDREMALHDLAMNRFGQWWRRMLRNGYGSLDVELRFGVTKFAHNNRRVRFWSAWFVLLLAVSTSLAIVPDSRILISITLLFFAVWPARWLRIAFRTYRKGHSLLTSVAYGFFMAISFLPQIVGQIVCLLDRLRNRSFRLVEYKS